MIRSSKTAFKRRRHSGFTLVEVLIAGVITAFIIGSISMTVAQLTRSKNSSRDRLAACLRADAALNAIRSSIITISRDTDLFYTRFDLLDGARDTPVGTMDRDEVLVFNTQLRAVRDLSFQGEGLEYETAFRIEDDPGGSVLWQRRDKMPDEYYRGGGQTTPKVDGIVGLSIEAYDGLDWYEVWDSDQDGLPQAVRVTVVASGHRNSEDLATAPIVTLRTIIPIDRVIPPKDWLLPTPEEELELDEYLDELLVNFGQGQQDEQENPDTGAPSLDDIPRDMLPDEVSEMRGPDGARNLIRRGGGRGPDGSGSGSGDRPNGSSGGRPAGSGSFRPVGSGGNQGGDE